MASKSGEVDQQSGLGLGPTGSTAAAAMEASTASLPSVPQSPQRRPLGPLQETSSPGGGGAGAAGGGAVLVSKATSKGGDEADRPPAAAAVPLPPPPPPPRELPTSPALPPEVALSPVQHCLHGHSIGNDTATTLATGGGSLGSLDGCGSNKSNDLDGPNNNDNNKGRSTNNNRDKDGNNANGEDNDTSGSNEEEGDISVSSLNAVAATPPPPRPHHRTGTAGPAAPLPRPAPPSGSFRSPVNLLPLGGGGGGGGRRHGAALFDKENGSSSFTTSSSTSSRSSSRPGLASVNSRTHLLAETSSLSPPLWNNHHQHQQSGGIHGGIHAGMGRGAGGAGLAAGGGGKKKKIKRTAAGSMECDHNHNHHTSSVGSPPNNSGGGANSAGGSGTGGILNRLGAKLVGRKRPPSVASSAASSAAAASSSSGRGASSSQDDEEGERQRQQQQEPPPSTPIRGGNNNNNSDSDEGNLSSRKPRNVGLPDVNSFPLGADAGGGGDGTSSTIGAVGGLRLFTKVASGRVVPSRKLNLGGSSTSSSSNNNNINSSFSLGGGCGGGESDNHDQAGLLDSDGKPTDTSLDMNNLSAIGGGSGAGGAMRSSPGGYEGDYRASPTRPGGGSATLTAAAMAAAAAAASSCPLTPTECTLSSRHLPPAAVLNTPPASSPSPLFVSAKKIGSEIRQRHGAKRRKGSSRRTKKARRSLRAAQKAAAAAGGVENMDGAVIGPTVSIAVPGSGGPRRLASSPPDRSAAAAAKKKKKTSTAAASSSKPVSVDDSFTSTSSSNDSMEVADSASGLRVGAVDEEEGDVSKSLEEMGLNTPTSSTESAQAVHNERRNKDDGIGPRDLSVDIPTVRRDTSGLGVGPPGGEDGSFPCSPRNRAFPLVLQPPSPSSSLSGSDDEKRASRSSMTRRAEDFDAGPWHNSHDRHYSGSSESSESETDTDSDDDSTVCRGYPPLPKPPETATKEEKSRFYWELLYGAPPPVPKPPMPPSSRPRPHLLAGFGSSSASLQNDQQEQPQHPGSWSASRLPPAKGILSSRKKKSLSLRRSARGPTANSTPMLTDRTTNFMFTSPSVGATAAVTASAIGNNDGLCTPTHGSPSFSQYDQTGDEELGHSEREEQQRPKHNVAFGISRAAEFDATRPTIEITVLPDEVAGARFPVDMVEDTEEEVVLHKETVDNSAMLAEWEDEFDSFLDEDDEDQNGNDDIGTESRSGTPSSPMDCDDNESACSDASGCIADDDMTPLTRPKRPRKKKRRKSKHRFTDSAEKDNRRKSSLFFSPGGGSLLGSDDEDDEATPMLEANDVPVKNLTTSSYSPEEASAEAGRLHPTEYFSPPSSEGARTSLEDHSTTGTGAQLQNVHSSGGASPTNDATSNQELFRPNHLGSMLEGCKEAPNEDEESIEIDESLAASSILKRAVKAQAMDCLDRPIVRDSFCLQAETNAKKAVSEFLLRRNNASDTHSGGLIDSICQIDPVIFKAVPPKVASEVRDGASPSTQLVGLGSGSGDGGIDTNATVADFCSQLAQAALHEWRSREVELMQEVSSSLQSLNDSCDGESSALQQLLGNTEDALASARRHTKSAGVSAPRHDPSKIVQEIKQLESDVDLESRNLEVSLKKRRLAEAQHELERQGPTSELAHQLLSTLMSVHVQSLGEDTLETSFQNADGTCSQVSWKIQCGGDSLGGSPDDGSLSSPRAIEGFSVSSYTSSTDLNAGRQKKQRSTTLAKFQRALLRGYFSTAEGSRDSGCYYSALDRFITEQANIHASFPTAFVAMADLLNKMRLAAIDITEVEGRSCTLEVQLSDDSMIGLLVKITFVDGSSLGVQLMYESLDGRNPATFAPMDVSVVSLGCDRASAIDGSLLAKLKGVVESILRRRQGCNAFLLKEICNTVKQVVANCTDEAEV